MVGVHDLHASTIATGLPVLTAHVVVEDACFAEGGDVVVNFVLARQEDVQPLERWHDRRIAGGGRHRSEGSGVWLGSGEHPLVLRPRLLGLRGFAT